MSDSRSWPAASRRDLHLVHGPFVVRARSLDGLGTGVRSRCRSAGGLPCRAQLAGEHVEVPCQRVCPRGAFIAGSFEVGTLVLESVDQRLCRVDVGAPLFGGLVRGSQFLLQRAERFAQFDACCPLPLERGMRLFDAFTQLEARLLRRVQRRARVFDVAPKRRAGHSLGVVQRLCVFRPLPEAAHGFTLGLQRLRGLVSIPPEHGRGVALRFQRRPRLVQVALQCGETLALGLEGPLCLRPCGRLALRVQLRVEARSRGGYLCFDRCDARQFDDQGFERLAR